ncbi:MAG: hypothetical protein DDT26_02112 [Dehalococcoidia bacterium]|nr:hypothetical protein [Chloroflexota bacterium]
MIDTGAPVGLHTPPQVLSMEEYHTRWRPQGWKLIIIGPTATWRQEWGTWEAIREIVQNALDETESYEWGYDRQGLWISDQGQGVVVRDFLLGPPKLKPGHARGKFGEGMKIGALALIRDGWPIKVETMGRELWVIFIEQPVNGKAETLAALWRPNGRPLGTVFRIIGYTGTAFEDRFAVNLPRASIIQEAPSLLHEPLNRFNQLISHPFPGDTSRVFARDIYMSDIKSPYSYNLWSFDMAPDRHAPKYEPDMWMDMGRLWTYVREAAHLERFLKMVCDPPLAVSAESYSINMDPWGMGNIPELNARYADNVKHNADRWEKAWEKVFGENAVIRTSSGLDGTVKHLGYTSFSLQHTVRGTLSLAITTDEDLIRASQARLREVEIIPDHQLTSRAFNHLALARAITHSIIRHGRRVSGVHAAIIPPASDRVRTAGMYSRTTQEIYISLEQLEGARATVDTVIHEIAHHTSRAEDGEKVHNAEMTAIAARVVELTARREFDEQLKKAIWL